MELIHGDCLEEMDKLIEKGVKVDCVITDLPYGTTKCRWDVVIPFEPMWDCLNKLTKNNSAIVLFGSQPFTTDLINSNRKMFRYEIIWNKTFGKEPFAAGKRPMKAHENILLFYKKQPIFNPQYTKGKPYKDVRKDYKIKTERYAIEHIGYINDGYRNPISVIDFKNPNFRGMHPTQKPVKLLEYLIKTYTNENELVLDFTMGSGSTGVACVNTNRNFIGIEKEEEYFNIAKERIKTAYGGD